MQMRLITSVYIRKSVIGSNIHIEVNDFLLTLDRVFNDSQRFGFSTRSLSHVMFSFMGTAQKAGAGGRSGGGGESSYPFFRD